jgi:serine/threonine-protein kinase RsbW
MGSSRPALRAAVSPLAAAPPGLSSVLTLTLPSDVGLVEEAIELVCRHLKAEFLSERAIRFNVRVALAEALANAIEYGNDNDTSKSVGVTVRFGPDRVEMEVTDEGPGFDPHRLPDPTVLERRSLETGRGIFLIQKLVDEVRFNEKGNSICMILRRA